MASLSSFPFYSSASSLLSSPSLSSSSSPPSCPFFSYSQLLKLRRPSHFYHSSPFSPKPSAIKAPEALTNPDPSFGNKQVISLTPRLYQYILHNTREPPILRELREETAAIHGSQMQVSPDQAQFLVMLAQVIGAERCIEVGVYTGYSSLSIALALPEHGHLVACEKDGTCLEMARKFYEKAGVSCKVDIRHELAADALESLIRNGEAASYDFAFIDGDKRMYLAYYEMLLKLLRKGGLLVIDDVLWQGRVADPLIEDQRTVNMRNFNKFVFEDKRVNVSMVPIGNGMTICQKL